MNKRWLFYSLVNFHLAILTKLFQKKSKLLKQFEIFQLKHLIVAIEIKVATIGPVPLATG